MVKILQLNVWGGRLEREVVRLINKIDADIVCLQEAIWSTKDNPISGLTSSFNNILKNVRYEHVIYSPTHSYSFLGDTVKFGNVMLSKIAVNSDETFFTHGVFQEVEHAEQKNYNFRNAQVVSFSIEGRVLTVVNHHGYHCTDPMGNEDSIKSLEKLVGRLQEIDGPIIVTGDLNVTPESPAMRVFDERFVNLTEKYDIRSTLSRFGIVSDVPCDHILITQDIKDIDFQVLDDLASDHLALYAELSLG